MEEETAEIIEMIPADAPEIPMEQADVEPDPWEVLDLKDSPFEWPDEERNLYTNGTQCTLWGRSAADMSQADLILFVGYLNILYSQASKVIAQQEDVEDETPVEEAK